MAYQPVMLPSLIHEALNGAMDYDRVKEEINNADFETADESDDWRSFIHYPFRSRWLNLSFESKVVLFLTAHTSACMMRDEGLEDELLTPENLYFDDHEQKENFLTAEPVQTDETPFQNT